MKPALRLALFEPDIPQNTAAVLRTCACLGVPAEIIEPCGFVFGGTHMRRAGMDYVERAEITRHVDWQAFQKSYPDSRRVLLTTKAASPFTGFQFQPGDILISGRESAGVPDHVHDACDARLLIPMMADMRSLNMAVAAAMVMSGALRQLSAFPAPQAASENIPE